MNRFVVLQTTVPDYRVAFFNALGDGLRGHAVLNVLAGSEYFSASVITRAEGLEGFERVPNHYLVGRRLLFQVIPWGRLFRADVVVLELNPRILSNWILLIVRYLMRRRCVLWGHAWSRSGAVDWTAVPRIWGMFLSSGLVVYTKTQERQLAEVWGVRSFAACNSTYSRSADFKCPQASAGDLVYVGRLVADKRVDYLVREFVDYVRKGGRGNLHIVGEGPMADELHRVVRECDSLSVRFCFHGHVSDLSTLYSIYSKCRFSISPGYVGLSAIQSFYMGVPMIVSRNEPHSPEIEACVNGFNSLIVPLDSTGDLAAFLFGLDTMCDRPVASSAEIAKNVRELYSVESMADAMVNASGLELTMIEEEVL